MAYWRSLQPVRPVHAQWRHREDVVTVDFSIAFSSSVNLPRRERKISFSCFRMSASSFPDRVWGDLLMTSFMMLRMATGVSIVPRRHAFSHEALHVSQGICGSWMVFDISLYALGSCAAS